MGNIKIRQGVFDTKLELEHASVVAGFPSPADDYTHETLEFYNVVFFMFKTGTHGTYHG